MIKRSIFTVFFLALTMSLSSSSVRAQTQDELYQQTEIAFNALCSGMASNSDLTVLKEALQDPRLNTQARTALEALNTDESRAVLRQGLDVSDSVCIAGTLDSLARLQDVESQTRIIEMATSDSFSEVVRCAALKALGRLTIADSMTILKQSLKDPNIVVQVAAADGLFSAGARLKDPELFCTVRLANVDKATTVIATQNEILLSHDVELFLTLLESRDKDLFKCACTIIALTDDASIIEATVDAIPRIEDNSRKGIILALGNSSNKSVVSSLLRLLKKTSSNGVPVEIVIQALASTKDEAAFDSLFDLFESYDEKIRKAAVDAVCGLNNLSNANVERIVQRCENTEDKTTLLSCLEVIGNHRIVQACDVVKQAALRAADVESFSAAVKVWAKIVDPNTEAIKSLVAEFGTNKFASEDILTSSVETLCKRAQSKEAMIALLEDLLADDKTSLARYVGVMGGKYAADYLGKLALKSVYENSDDAIAILDEATKALGKWPTADASSALAKLAVLLPEERLGKFKTRAIRGYIRIVRQMGELPLVKLQKIATAKRLTENRPQERELLGTIDARFTWKFQEKSLFNGKDLDGWEEYDKGIFSVENGAIVGGNFDTGVQHNQFLTSVDSYGDFYLRLECKLVVGDANHNNDGNAGVQFRSVRIPDNWEMIGYQADMSSDGAYWGCLYDESRRNLMLQIPDSELQNALLAPNDWNTYEILAQGKNIQLFLNGVLTVEYTEEDETIPLEGKIGLQIHAGGPARAYYRNIFICDVSTDDSK